VLKVRADHFFCFRSCYVWKKKSDTK
jgi:hypothetical protein